MPIRVVKINAAHNNFTRYIGRPWAGIMGSVLHNPFHIVGSVGTRSDVLRQFIIYWYAPEQHWLRAHALEVIKEDEVLGCWCKPLQCHGDIIAGYVTWRREGEGLLWSQRNGTLSNTHHQTLAGLAVSAETKKVGTRSKIHRENG